MSKTLRDRFWEKVNLFHGITDEDCWEWTAAKSTRGYGRFGVGGKNRFAHRICFQMYRPGDFDGTLHCCHHCDNPACVNPWHLFMGTDADNNRDMIKKGRYVFAQVKGEKHPRSKLKVVDIHAIRKLKRPQSEIAKRFGISQANVSLIKTGKIWGFA